MKGLGKILIAVDLGMAAVVGGMKLYLDADLTTEERISPVSGTHLAPLPDAPPDTAYTAPVPDAGFDTIPLETWLIAATALLVVLGIVGLVALALRAHLRAVATPADEEAMDDDRAASSAHLPAPREEPAGGLFRAPAPSTDRPVFGRAPRRIENV
ncbi:hypothetical protein sos41_32920 [Alphaproteobacteria bacterium SO-S41]|nr:hypothetical protein sos41_32920 [Alphaproteobacteria bacterium SO-S41]